MLNINIFGGPGAGKSTAALHLASDMKKLGMNAEFIPEYAKDLVFAREDIKLSDQLHILGEQHHRIFRLKDKVQYLIHDSPFVMGLVYLQEDAHLPAKIFEQLSVTLFKSYSNLNIFLERNPSFEFQQIGRQQNHQDSLRKDVEIKTLLARHNIPFCSLSVQENLNKQILGLI